MERFAIAPRPDHQQKLEAQGLSFHAWDDYWREDACYRFTLAQVEDIEAATAELHAMCKHAVRVVVAQGRLGQLGIPAAMHDLVADSLRRDDFSLYGRFDLAFDGRSPPKLLEYNADTPTSLLESAVCQWHWMEDVRPGTDQFNSLHDKLIARWRQAPGTGLVHVACIKDNEEDWVCASYLRDTIEQAGRPSALVYVEDIGWHEDSGQFLDLDNQPIDTLFKLYPWEWLGADAFAEHIARATTCFIEPAWKAVMSSKGLLPILWELYPEHPNLLPAYFAQSGLTQYARKPFFSREGANVQLWRDAKLLAEDTGPYGQEGFVYQALCLLPEFGGHYPVVGAWVVGDEPAGMCVREDISPITTNMSHFVPHLIED